ncbi:MAG: chromosome segregation protein SMC [Lachnospiraceae bacterium]|jgi:chromosome segregation protein
MYLKSIEVQGFKSFANKLNFEFHNGITGIVGPNGSGKSNVADAVRWVLGEQSAKQLRGGNMQDVIFAGTQLRKPLSFASVAITLDNSDHVLDIDYDEVTVMRRLYRSGESEYLLNGTNVRLKDINELFYDTGIGKEGYSIIGQGRIDQIISGKQEEKRALIDEAAGIVKYKRRKNAALKKLENERSNLTRVNDILRELSGRVEPLRKQSEKAKIYLDKKHELKRLDINMYLIEKKVSAEKIAEIDEKLSITESQTEASKAEFERTKSEYDSIEKRLEEIDVRIAGIHSRDEENKVYIQELFGNKELINEQIRALEKNAQANLSRTEEVNKEAENRRSLIETDENKLSDTREKLINVRETRKASELKLAAVEAALEAAGFESGNAKSEIIDILNSRAQVKGELQRYGALNEQITLRRDEIARKEKELKKNVEEINESLAGIRNRKSRIDSEISKYEGMLKTSNDGIAKLETQIDNLNKDIEVKTSSYHLKASRLETLKGIAEHYEGYGNAIQNIMAMKGSFKGIEGVVADIIKTEKKYETAIETALGGNIRSIVTKDQKTAKDLIAYLKKERLGRVTFFPVDAMTASTKDVNENVFGEDGVIGLASDLVSYDEAYSELVKYLLGRTFVVDTIDNAIKIGNKYRHRLFMVTLEGDSFSPGGSMTGGAYRAKSSLLGRQRELSELKESSQLLKKEVDELHRALKSKTDSLEKIKESIRSVNEILQKQYIFRNTVEIQISQIMEKSDAIDEEREALKKERDELAGQIEDIKENTLDASKVLNSSQEREKALNDSVSILEERIEKLESEKETVNGILGNIRIEEAGLLQTQEYLSEELERLESELKHFETEAEALGQVLERNRDSVSQKKKLLEETVEKIEKAMKTGEGNLDSENALKEEKDRMKEKHRGFFEKRESIQNRLSLLDKEAFRLQAQKEKIQESMSSLASYIWEEYELTPSEADKLRDDSLTDRAALKSEVQSLRSYIRGLGQINVNAIDEYKEVLERHTFLSEQHSDLVKSEESLIKIINELDKGMRLRFNEKFSEINREFDTAFKELFGGGKGVLVLEEGADVLEAEISIISQPPGKKLQNMMQLSGGEKSLTAIALLFAIQNLKPSPFCLLDEIEAALDEANVSKFTKYLQKLKDNTQFIVITHRRGTMSSADRLYGITMQEKGVSTLVSVNLVEEQLDA